MLGSRVRTYRRRIREEFEAAFEEDHTPHQIAISFAIGIFITALPTLGAGLLVFFGLVYAFTWINKLALFGSVLVLNPVVKPAVYLASFQVGEVLMDPEPVVLFDITVLDTVVNITRRLLIGNLLVAAILAVAGYVIVHRLTIEYRQRDHDLDLETEIVDRLEPEPK